ncbi:hypothetical protein [Oribacterium sp. Sow4_G1_1]|uniref:hypothetical protein n=1 Tax=Oribacterium sp. Sow4_G1_1 TaxID=3438794 RepID=UPI003F9E7376
MNKIDKAKERIIAMLNREISKTRLERAAIVEKMEDAEEWYGQGKRYQAYREKLDKKLQEEESLMDMKTRFGGFVPTQETGFLTMYGFACPSCGMHVYLDRDKLADYQNGTVNCPVCGRRIYRDGRSASWEVLVDSKTVKE